MYTADGREEEKAYTVDQGWMRKLGLIDLAESTHSLEPSLPGLQAWALQV